MFYINIKVRKDKRREERGRFSRSSGLHFGQAAVLHCGGWAEGVGGQDWRESLIKRLKQQSGENLRRD